MKFDELTTMPPINVKFTHSKKKYRKWMARIGCEANFDESDAQVTFTKRDDGEHVNYVYLTSSLENSAAQDAAILAHEASHIADDYFEHTINEDRPSGELRAYVIENITQYLVERHFKWKRRKLEAKS